MNNSLEIKKIAKVTNGKSDVKDAIDNGKYLFFDRSSIIKRSDSYLFDSESIIIPGEDSRQIFEPRYYKGKFNLHQRCYVIYDFKEEFCPKYLFYKLKTLTKHFENVNVGSTVPSLRLDHITDLKINFPNYKIQKSIAKVLSDLDAKIELNNKTNRELEAMAKTLYDYWFVQFDFPDANGKPYKSSGGKMVYNAELKREIPDVWEVKKLGKVLKTVLGGTPSTKNNEFWDNGEYYWLNSGEIANFPIITSELKITEGAILNSATSLMPKGTVTISITRHIRPSILAVEACANQSVIGILESSKLKSSYLYPFITNEVPRYLTLRTGAQQPHINKQTIDNTLIFIPEMEVLENYYKIVDPTYNQIINYSFQNQHLTALRDWLLPMLMNGQVTVKEAEERISMAAEPRVKYNKLKN
jgi:type I restriction enzyme S subunit